MVYGIRWIIKRSMILSEIGPLVKGCLAKCIRELIRNAPANESENEYANGEYAMRNRTAFVLILIFIAAHCAAREPIQIGGESGFSTLERVSDNMLISSNNPGQFNDSNSYLNSSHLINYTGSQSPAPSINSSNSSGSSSSSLNDSTLANITESQTRNTAQNAKSDLWSWGSVPPGYTRDKFGNLVKLSSTEEWQPSV